MYSTWAAFQGTHYTYENYLSPMYSPELFGDSHHSIFGPKPGWWPGWLPFSPAFLILWAPAGFRLTCYYYRGAYYKAFWADPPSCSVGEPRKSYLGENSFPLILQNVHRYFLYLALAFLVFLSYDAFQGFFFIDEATGAKSFGIGVGSFVLTFNVILLRGLYVRLPLPAPPGRRLHQSVLQEAHELPVLALRLRLQPQAHAVGLVQPVLGGLLGRLRASVLDGNLDRLENRLMDLPVHRYDVLVIGAGGAGLRAAIEASSAGASVGVICKSLLGKAHTVMAEGGVAAAIGNVDERDNWKVHVTDTLRGGQYLCNPRMAELHAKEAPARVKELEAWGALFDRTKDGRILQRNFGGHRYPRLAHVGDRTGLEMIRTLQDHGIHQGIEFHMEHTVIRLLKDGDRVVGAFGYDRERGRFRVFQARAVVMATGGIGRAFKITSNSWEYTGDGHALAYRAGAELIDMEFVQFHPTGMVWPPSVRGILVTEGVRGEGGILKNSDGHRFMFDDIPDLYKDQTADNPEEGWRYTQGDREARRPPELLTRDHVARCIVRPDQGTASGSPHGGVFLDIAWIKEKLLRRGGAHQEEAAEHVPPVQGAGGARHHQGGDGGGADHPLRDGRHSRRCRQPDVDGAGPVRRRRVRGRAARRQPARRQFTVRPAGLRPACRRVRCQVRRRQRRRPARRGSGRRGSRCGLAPLDSDGQGENPFQVQYDLQEMMQEKVGIVRIEDDMRQALEGIEQLKARAAKVSAPGNREYNPGWHTALDLDNLLVVSEAVARSGLIRKESRGAHFRDDYPEKDEAFATSNTSISCGPDGEMKVEQTPLVPMSEELQALVEEMK